MMCRRAAVALVGLSVLTAPAAGRAMAQVSTFEIVPVAGVFLPSGELASGRMSVSDGQVVDVAVDQSSSLLLGIRIGNWWSPVFGWEGAFSYALSDVTVWAEVETGQRNLCGSDLDCSGGVWTFTSKARARYARSRESRWYLYGAVGLAVVGHVGDVLNRGQATTDLGVVFGVGGAVDLSDRFALSLDAEDYLYGYTPRVGSDTDSGLTDARGRTQNDIVVSLGVVLRLFGR